MIRTYNQAVKYLEKYIPTEEKKHPGVLGLSRMEYLVNILGNPQNSFKSIHVGGTSGKGSTATIIASILATKYKTGLHTSPHLVKVNERIKINGNDISNEEFVSLVNEIIPAVEKMGMCKWGVPSYFEIVTVMAFLYFKKQKVDYAVIEVGMGGKFDATNMINPEVAVLTNVGLDHTEVLGNTVEEIARDKAGIIKSNICVITGVKQPSVIKIIKARSTKHEARINILNKDFKFKTHKITDKGSYFDYLGNKIYKNLFVSLLGTHQVENAVLAIRAVEQLSGFQVFRFSGKNLRLGLKQAHISGRMEIARRKPLVVLDGAHNSDKMKALVESIKAIWPAKKVKLILAIKEGKNAEEMLRILISITKKIVLTQYDILIDQGQVKSFIPEKLKNLLDKIEFDGEIKIISDPKKAIEAAITETGGKDMILVTGSLYLVGLIRQNINEK